MSLSSFSYDHSSNTEYLVDDYLKFRVDAVFYSTPLLSLTPAWQLISIHSGAHFTISEYFKRKQFNNEHYSPPFTSRPQGYKLWLRVHANGHLGGKGSHLLIYGMIMKGEHDDNLQWPFTGTISIELLNWLEHYKRTLSIGTNDIFVRVTNKVTNLTELTKNLVSDNSKKYMRGRILSVIRRAFYKSVVCYYS